MSKTMELQRRKAELLASEKPPRAREAAKQLGVSEAEYVALSCGDGDAANRRLKREGFVAMLQALHQAGEVMALTRNEAVVMEHHGVYRNAVVKHNHVMFIEPEMDLRLKVTAWQYGFAVNENGRRSLQFFAADGQAAHKIYMTEASDREAYDKLVAQYGTDGGFEGMSVSPTPTRTPDETAMLQVDANAIRKDWRALDNAHHVNALLKAYGLTRPQVYRYLGDEAVRLQPDALKSLLEQASDQAWSLLMFVPNGAATQIHNGTVHKLMEMGPWFNVLDAKFNLHANLALITQAWWVRKPSDGRMVTSLELFDADDNAVMMVYLHPDDREPERLAQWDAFLLSLSVFAATATTTAQEVT